MNNIELRPAYVWYCNECGEEAYQPIMIIETDKDTRLTRPSCVECPSCGTQYRDLSFWTMKGSK